MTDLARIYLPWLLPGITIYMMILAGIRALKDGEPVGLFRKTDGAWKQVPDEWADHPNVRPLYTHHKEAEVTVTEEMVAGRHASRMGRRCQRRADGQA